ncbi:hypothetical protein PAPYR_4545 [Paratrimastix pyriformis]|uniref:Uncharacterized protein n=1 Tax=Paratrimastix pyriformis TaxID=342808 RepID=A0ABQ8UJS8_9EUKA|nr:hypothetical protein PAPYR_4545 [Paratrimastix pyriformis]
MTALFCYSTSSSLSQIICVFERRLNRRFWHLTSFWHRFDLTPLPCSAKLTPEAFTQLMTRCPYVTYLNLDVAKMLNKRQVNTPEKVGAMLDALPKLCPCLRHLDLREFQPRLDRYSRIPSLETLAIDLVGLALHDVDLTSWYHYDSARLTAGSRVAAFGRALAQLLPNLRTLSLIRGQCDVRFADTLVQSFRGQLRRLDLRGVILTYDGSPQGPGRGRVAADQLFKTLVPELGGASAAHMLAGVEELDLGNTRCTDEVLRRVGLLFPNLRRLSVFGCALLGADMLLELAGRPLARTLEWLNLSAPPYHEVACPRLRRLVVPPHWLDSTPRRWADPLPGDPDHPKPPPVRPFVEAEADTTHRQLVLAQFPRVQFIGSAEIDAL